MTRLIVIGAAVLLGLASGQSTTTTNAPHTTTTSAPQTTPAPNNNQNQGATDNNAVETKTVSLPLITQAALPTLLPTLPWSDIINNGGGFWYYNNGVRTYFPLSSWFINTFRTVYPVTTTVTTPVVTTPVVTTPVTTVTTLP